MIVRDNYFCSAVTSIRVLLRIIFLSPSLVRPLASLGTGPRRSKSLALPSGCPSCSKRCRTASRGCLFRNQIENKQTNKNSKHRVKKTKHNTASAENGIPTGVQETRDRAAEEETSKAKTGLSKSCWTAWRDSSSTRSISVTGSFGCSSSSVGKRQNDTKQQHGMTLFCMEQNANAGGRMYTCMRPPPARAESVDHYCYTAATQHHMHGTAAVH